MNKQEAIEELMSKSREIIFGDDENVYLSRKRTIELVSQIVTDGNKLYLKEFDELNAIIIIDDVVGTVDYAKRYEDKAEAQKAADELGWFVEEVE